MTLANVLVFLGGFVVGHLLRNLPKRKSYLPYRINRLESKMGAFDNAVADLAARVNAILAVLASDAAALEEARRAVAEAEANAARVVAEDAAEDEAQDQVRAGALAGISAQLDSVLNPATEVPVAEEPAPVDAPVAEAPVEPETPAAE